MFARGTDGFFHPASEEDLERAITFASDAGVRVRVRGSAHSIGAAIYTGLAGPDSKHLDLMLDRMCRVRFDDSLMRVTVQGGCHLGRDPRDHTGTSRWEASLTTQLDRRGWALPDLGGVTHQTVAGFLMTGSAGGSTSHSLYDAIVSVRIIDGLGVIHDWSRSSHTRFFAFASSLGLLGVLIDVTFQCEERYDVIGQEHITPRAAAAFTWNSVDSASGTSETPCVAEFLRATEYARFMWWPQRHVDRVVSWTARRAVSQDLAEHRDTDGRLSPKAYSALGDSLRTPTLTPIVNYASQLVAGAFYDSMAHARHQRDEWAQRIPATQGLLRPLRHAFEERVFPAVLDAFLPPHAGDGQRFWGPWHHVLPMDNQMVDAFLPTDFAEMWFDLDDADDVMRTLHDHFERGGLRATGTFLFEFYACASSDFWMHPSFGRDSFRVDLFWFKRNKSSPNSFFEEYWRLLAPYRYRVHWGKHFPPWESEPMSRCLESFAHLQEFLSLRRALDPNDTFVSPHWRGLIAYGES